LLAVSRWPLLLSSQVKPYSLDLLASVGFLTLALHGLRQPARTRWLALLVLVVPLALGSSFPAVFVAGSVGVVLLPVAWQRNEWAPRLLFAAYCVLLGAGFLVFDVLIGQQQLGPQGNRLHDSMMEGWNRAFPPHDPVSLGKWLVYTHFGPLTAYPFGKGSAAGVVTFPLMLLGVWVCRRRGQRQLLALLLLPFALTLAAAVLGKYPYGGCTRLSQHLAPAGCLWSGVGITHLGKLISRRAEWRCRAVWVIGCLLAGFGLVQATYWSFRPYRDVGDLWARRLATGVMGHIRPGDRVLYTVLPESVRIGTVWYLRVHNARPVSYGKTEWTEALESREPVWLLTTAAAADPSQRGSPVGLRANGMPARKIEHRASFGLPDSSRSGCRLRADLWEIRALD
jgi:hypothetical protein